MAERIALTVETGGLRWTASSPTNAPRSAIAR